MRYNIYAGLSGGFGGYKYQYTNEFISEDEAYEVARDLAIEEYQNYEGLHGLPSYEDILKEYCAKNNINEKQLTGEDLNYIDDLYNEEMDGWLSFKITTIEEDPEHNQEYRH